MLTRRMMQCEERRRPFVQRLEMADGDPFGLILHISIPPDLHEIIKLAGVTLEIPVVFSMRCVRFLKTSKDKIVHRCHMSHITKLQSRVSVDER